MRKRMNLVHPSAICRQKLAQLDRHKTLSPAEQRQVHSALQKTGIKVERVIASISKNAIKSVLKDM